MLRPFHLTVVITYKILDIPVATISSERHWYTQKKAFLFSIHCFLRILSNFDLSLCYWGQRLNRLRLWVWKVWCYQCHQCIEWHFLLTNLNLWIFTRYRHLTWEIFLTFTYRCLWMVVVYLNLPLAKYERLCCVIYQICQLEN